MIEAPRLKLIPFTETAIEAILANDLEKLGELLDIKTPEAWTAFDGAAEAIGYFYEMIRSLKGDLRFGGYFVVLKNERRLIGTGGYKGMQDYPNSVEIGYEIHPYDQGHGYATEMARALVEFAILHQVKTIKAHTLAEENASGKILIRLGFQKTGEIIDPTDGKLWAWEFRPLNLQPNLKGELLLLRPLQEQDYDELFLAASDPLIWELHPQPTRYQPDVFRNFFKEAMESKGALAVIDLKTSKIIGSTRYYDYLNEPESVAIGYTFLTRKYWGGIYNRELKRLTINHALESVKTTLFHVGIQNIRSQKAMEKIGGINTGIQEIAVSYAPPKKSYVYKIEKRL